MCEGDEIGGTACCHNQLLQFAALILAFVLWQYVFPAKRDTLKTTQQASKANVKAA